MFAYCNNNSICNSDPFGKSLYPSTFLCSDKAPSKLHSSQSIALKKRAMEIKRNIATEDSWKSLSAKEKKAMVVSYYRQLQDLLGISNYTLTFDRPKHIDSRDYGMCNEVEAYIWINSADDYLNSYEVLATVAHECYHAYQNNSISGSTNEPAYIIDIWKEDDNSVRFGGVRSMHDYYWSPKEQGARWFERDTYETVTGCETP